MADLGAVTIAARLDRLPATAEMRRLVTLISLGGCFEFYDLFFTGYVAPGLAKSGLLTATTTAFFGFSGFASFVAATFAGMLIGTLLVSWLSDRFGRRSVFTWSLLWYSTGTLILAFQNDAQSLDLWRFIASIGLGVELVNIDTYISELTPKDRRGSAFAYNEGIMFLAIPAAALVSWLLVPETILGLDGWRWVMIVGATGAIFVWWLRMGLPESPRWLAQHGHMIDAEEIVGALESAVRLQTGQDLPEPVMVSGEAESVKGGWSEIWRAPYLNRTMVLTVFNLLQTVGYYGFSAWVPTLLIAQGITVTKSLEYTLIIAIAAPVSPFFATMVADKFERKYQIAAAAVAVAVFGLLFSQQTTPLGVIIFGILITLSNNWMSFAFHAYQTELYPTRIRAQAVGLVYSWSRLSVVFSSFVIAFFLRDYGTIGVFVFIGACMLGVAGVVGIAGPRTRKLRLEQVAP
ncbi:MAG TPA: MFS transporter [Magnetospirillaceae bacterium]|jgi:putative MFS transporter